MNDARPGSQQKADFATQLCYQAFRVTRVSGTILRRVVFWFCLPALIQLRRHAYRIPQENYSDPITLRLGPGLFPVKEINP